jgi:hypothetical protein
MEANQRLRLTVPPPRCTHPCAVRLAFPPFVPAPGPKGRRQPAIVKKSCQSVTGRFTLTGPFSLHHPQIQLSTPSIFKSPPRSAASTEPSTPPDQFVNLALGPYYSRTTYIYKHASGLRNGLPASASSPYPATARRTRTHVLGLRLRCPLFVLLPSHAVTVIATAVTLSRPSPVHGRLSNCCPRRGVSQSNEPIQLSPWQWRTEEEEKRRRRPREQPGQRFG